KKELLQRSKERLAYERMVATSASDRTNYGSIEALTHALNKVGSTNLIRCFVKGSFENLIRMFWKPEDLRLNSELFIRTTLSNLIEEKLKHNKTSIVRSMAAFTKVFMATKIPRHTFTFLDQMNDNFEDVLRDDTLIMNLMKRLGDDHKKAVHHMAKLSQSIVDEYQEAIDNAPWRLDEDRFGYTKTSIMSSYLRNMSFAVRCSE
ncbi:hypothetical protein PFISCL1PPCAC_25831, partial [Pristionchus fissidentatus]